MPAEPGEREEMRRHVGTDEIPVVLFDDGTILKGDADEIVQQLGERFTERPDAEEHRRRARDPGLVGSPGP